MWVWAMQRGLSKPMMATMNNGVDGHVECIAISNAKRKQRHVEQRTSRGRI
jgi:hypothetical protein